MLEHAGAIGGVQAHAIGVVGDYRSRKDKPGFSFAIDRRPGGWLAVRLVGRSSRRRVVALSRRRVVASSSS
jgi:hypothetical protein